MEYNNLESAGAPDDSPENISEEIQNYLNLLDDGCILLSRENLADPNFASTMVLICAYTAEGAYGLTLNRPSHMPLSEVFNSIGALGSQRRTIYIGGPVRQEILQVLQITDTPVYNAYQIDEKLFLGGDWTSIDQILSAQEENTLLFLGYSGWATGQLENEILDQAWEVYRVNHEQLFLVNDPRLTSSISDIREYLQCISVPPSS